MHWLRWLISDPIFTFIAGSVISILASFWANYAFFGKMEKSRAAREAGRAYNKLTSRLIHTTITDVNPPLHVLPVEISDRIEDLRFAIADVNPKFDYLVLANKAIKQAAELRKQQQEKYPTAPPSTSV